MLNRIYYIFALVFVLLPFSVFSQDCYFDQNLLNCSRFVDSLNEFEIDFDPALGAYDFDAQLYNKENPNNRILVEIEGENIVKQINPFLEPGVYVLEISVLNKAGEAFTENFEFVFDNLQPMAPFINMDLFSDSTSIVVDGSTLILGTKVYGKVNGGNAVSAVSDSNGEFSLTLSLSNGINYVQFYSENANGVKSASLERIVVGGGEIGLVEGFVDLSSLNDLSVLNERTVKSGNDYVTSKRNFYVSGSASGSEGEEVYVNGVRAKFDGSKFGAFVLLNEGENLIEVRSGDDSALSAVVYYNDFKFKFEEFDYEKVVSADSMSFAGTVNYDLPFDLYLNGNFVSRVVPSGGGFSETLSGLRVGKNFVYAEGLNGEVFFDIVYRDNEEPQVEIMTSSEIYLLEDFAFKATDDTGFETGFLHLDIGGVSYESDNVEMFGDYYVADISSFDEGSYDYSLQVIDRVGKSKTITGTLNINDQITAIESFDFENGGVVGNVFYVSAGEQVFTLHPSRHIAFQNIYLDGSDVIDYQIRSNGDVDVIFDFSEQGGEVVFDFINSDRESFSQTFTYFSDEDKPVLELDYIERPFYSSGNSLRISGRVVDEYFDWSSLTFNGEDNFLRYGENFEAYIEIGSGELNLEVYGEDHSSNVFDLESRVFGGVLYGDVTQTEVSVSSENRNFFEGSLVSLDVLRNRNFVYSYDGFDFSRAFLNRGALILPIQDRQGIRSLAMSGFESSLNKFEEIDFFTVDSTKPKVEFVQDRAGFVKMIIDGTYSAVDDSSLVVKVNTQEVSVSSDCDSTFADLGEFEVCREVAALSGDSIALQVSDVFGNEVEKSYSVSSSLTPEPEPHGACDVEIGLGTLVPQIYFNGNDKFTLSSPWFLQGSVLYDGNIDFVKADGKKCSFDGNNFVCEVSLSPGENSIEIEARDNEGCFNSAFYNVTYLDSYSIDVSILGVVGDGVFKVGSDYLLLDGNIQVDGVVSENSVVKVYVGDSQGREILVGEQSEGEFRVDVDLDSQIAGKNEDEFDLWLEAEDSNGGRGISERISFIYNRIVETIIDIVVG